MQEMRVAAQYIFIDLSSRRRNVDDGGACVANTHKNERRRKIDTEKIDTTLVILELNFET